MEKTKIYGASDDLIEIEGAVKDETNHYGDERVNFSASDGSKGTIRYDVDGIWRINIKKEGSLFDCLAKTEGEDKPHTNPIAIGCPSYSDVLSFKPGIIWVKIGRKTFRP